MKQRVFSASVSVLAIALMFELAAPTASARPELVITDMDAARASFDGSSSDGWTMYGDVSYVFADSVRYQDGSRSRPHTDVDVWLTACPPPVDPTGSPEACLVLRGTTNLQDMPDAGSFTEMTGATITGVVVNLSGPSGEVATVETDLDWEAIGPIRKLREIEPGVSALVGKQRDATVSGTVEVGFASGPFQAFAGTYSTFQNPVIQNYNEVFLGE